MAAAANGAPAGAGNIGERRRRAAACALIGLMFMFLVTNPAVLGSGSSGASQKQATTVAGGIPAWLRASASGALAMPDAPRRDLERKLAGAHPVGFSRTSLPPANLTSFFRGVWQTPSADKPLRQVPLANTT